MPALSIEQSYIKKIIFANHFDNYDCRKKLDKSQKRPIDFAKFYCFNDDLIEARDNLSVLLFRT